jgi:hypothetical protein
VFHLLDRARRALPPGVPYREQQYATLMAEHGYLDPPEAEMSELAQRVAELMDHDGDRR